MKPGKVVLIVGLIVAGLLAACGQTDPTLVAETAAPGVTASVQNPTPTLDVPATETPILMTNTPRPSEIRIVLTPIITPGLDSIPAACEAAPRNRLIVGERGRVNDDDMRPLNVRAGASTELRILGRLEVGDVFDVLAGPQCGGEYTWYLVRRQDGLEGWIAEGTPGLYFVEPYLPG